MPKLIGLAIYDINSIGTNNKASKNVVLEGKNKEKVWLLYFLNVMILIPIKTVKDNVKVIIKWLVTVKL